MGSSCANSPQSQASSQRNKTAYVVYRPWSLTGSCVDVRLPTYFLRLLTYTSPALGLYVEFHDEKALFWLVVSQLGEIVYILRWTSLAGFQEKIKLYRISKVRESEGVIKGVICQTHCERF